MSVTSFFISLTFYLLLTTLALYAIEQFHVSDTSAGFASSIFVIGAVFSRLVAGKYMELIGRKRLIYGSLICFLIAVIGYLPIAHFALLLTVRFLHGVAFGLATTVMSTAVISMIPKERKGEGISFYTLGNPIAMAIGPFLGILITQQADFQMIFIVCIVFSILNLVLILFAKIPEATLNDAQKQELKRFHLEDFVEKSALIVSSMMLILGVVYTSILTFMNSYAINIHLENAFQYFFLVYAFFLLVSRPFAGKLLDKKGENIVIYPALFSFFIGLIGVSVAHNGVVLLFSAAFLGLGLGNLISTCQAIVVKNSPMHRVGLATSTYFIALDAGIGIGPIVIGTLIPLVGFRTMYLIMAGIVVLTTIFYFVLHGKNVHTTKQK